jgi:hypothetical protein
MPSSISVRRHSLPPAGKSLVDCPQQDAVYDKPGTAFDDDWRFAQFRRERFDRGQVQQKVGGCQI